MGLHVLCRHARARTSDVNHHHPASVSAVHQGCHRTPGFHQRVPSYPTPHIQPPTIFPPLSHPQMALNKILITGGSRGIGLAIAHRLAGQGASCILMARNGNVLEQAVMKLPVGNGQKHGVIAGDVSSPDVWEMVRREYVGLPFPPISL
jgi:hypothetical protein